MIHLSQVQSWTWGQIHDWPGLTGCLVVCCQGDSGRGISSVNQGLNLPHVKFLFPTAPEQPITCFGGAPARGTSLLAHKGGQKLAYKIRQSQGHTASPDFVDWFLGIILGMRFNKARGSSKFDIEGCWVTLASFYLHLFQVIPLACLYYPARLVRMSAISLYVWV